MTICRSFALSTWILFILLLQPVNGVQFLNIPCLFVSFPSVAVASLDFGPSVIAIAHFQVSMHHYDHIN